MYIHTYIHIYRLLAYVLNCCCQHLEYEGRIGSFLRIVLPTLLHDIIYFLGAVSRGWHIIASFNLGERGSN